MLYETHHADRLHTLMTMSWVSRASVYTCIHAPTAPRTCLSGKCVSIPYGFPWISSSLPLPPYPSTQLSLQIRLVILGNINYNNSKIIIIISISRVCLSYSLLSSSFFFIFFASSHFPFDLGLLIVITVVLSY